MKFSTEYGYEAKIDGYTIEQIRKIQSYTEDDDMRTWTKDEAEEWLERNEFSTDRYEEMANYHSYRQLDPDQCDEIRAETDPFGFDEDDGVHALYCIPEGDDEGSEVQSIRFYHGGDDDS